LFDYTTPSSVKGIYTFEFWVEAKCNTLVLDDTLAEFKSFFGKEKKDHHMLRGKI
jgi:hypothetical protein